MTALVRIDLEVPARDLRVGDQILDPRGIRRVLLEVALVGEGGVRAAWHPDPWETSAEDPRSVRHHQAWPAERLVWVQRRRRG